MGKVNKNDIINTLLQVGLRQGDTVMVHASLSSFGMVENGADDVIDALLETVGHSGTIVMPTFTWSEFHNKNAIVFDMNNAPSGSGKISEVFRQHPDAIRSEHLLHSVAAMGANATLIMGDGISSWGKGSSFDALYQLDAWNLLIGVGTESCTAIHVAEEIVGVPYRQHKYYNEAKIILPDGTGKDSQATGYLRLSGYENDFGKMFDIFDAKHLWNIAYAGKSRFSNARIRKIIDTTVGLLKDDENFLLAK